MTSIDSDDQYDRRFNGIARLYGADSFARFAGAHVAIIGLGGVGSWAAEALARTGVGTLTLIDLDVLVASNVNRQLPALTETFGRSKADVLADRARSINPRADIRVRDDFLTADNVATLLADRPDIVLDCTDDMKAKLAMVMHCRYHKLYLIMVGAAGGKTDPTRIAVDDLARTTQDPLLAKLRSRLRKEYGFPIETGKTFGVRCIYSTEPVRPPSGQTCIAAGLHCDGYGSGTVMTASMGLFAVAEALKRLERTKKN